MDHGTKYLRMAPMAAAAGMSAPTGVHTSSPVLKPVPRKKGPVKKPPDKPMPLPDRHACS